MYIFKNRFHSYLYPFKNVILDMRAELERLLKDPASLTGSHNIRDFTRLLWDLFLEMEHRMVKGGGYLRQVSLIEKRRAESLGEEPGKSNVEESSKKRKRERSSFLCIYLLYSPPPLFLFWDFAFLYIPNLTLFS